MLWHYSNRGDIYEDACPSTAFFINANRPPSTLTRLLRPVAFCSQVLSTSFAITLHVACKHCKTPAAETLCAQRTEPDQPMSQADRLTRTSTNIAIPKDDMIPTGLSTGQWSSIGQTNVESQDPRALSFYAHRNAVPYQYVAGNLVYSEERRVVAFEERRGQLESWRDHGPLPINVDEGRTRTVAGRVDEVMHAQALPDGTGETATYVNNITQVHILTILIHLYIPYALTSHSFEVLHSYLAHSFSVKPNSLDDFAPHPEYTSGHS
nr:hypothetical protein CFP56_24060 [Quercus suber]